MAGVAFRNCTQADTMLFKDIRICMKCVRAYMHKGTHATYSIFFCRGVNNSEAETTLVEFTHFLCVLSVIKHSIPGGQSVQISESSSEVNKV